MKPNDLKTMIMDVGRIPCINEYLALGVDLDEVYRVDAVFHTPQQVTEEYGETKKVYALVRVV
jgi:hypothetical protein